MSNNTGDDYGNQVGINSHRDTAIQIGLSAVLGVSAFLTFCFLRPKWPSLYAARKQQRGEASPLPELSDGWFVWIWEVFKITEQQVLASAGLDSYVFLRFFKFATKFLCVTLFFALVVLKPVHDAFPDNDRVLRSNETTNSTASDNASIFRPLFISNTLLANGTIASNHTDSSKPVYERLPTGYLSMYLVFAYVFTALAMYLLVTETKRIIAIRQEYLGSRSTVSDRTIRLSGIPVEMRSEAKLKDFIERLQIGKVDSVTLCRNWETLDEQMDRRLDILRKLEEAWTVYLGKRQRGRSREILLMTQNSAPEVDDQANDDRDEENGRLLNGSSPSERYSQDRPKLAIGAACFGLGGRRVDAIHYWEEKLRRLDEEIESLRKQDFNPTALAFITMDSVASCQMAVQAVLDSSPMQMIANQSPAPGDVIWANTYLPRSNRMFRAWTITFIILLLSIFWSLVLVPLATALNVQNIQRVWPELGDALEHHQFAQSLVKTQLPTLLSSLLFVIVPYLYDWLSTYQGMTCWSEIELSVISKNFFFVFFNYFVIFTILGTFSNFLNFWERFQDIFKDTTRVAYTLARSLQNLEAFYTNLIILQGLGLFPFRLLEIGSVFLYPIYRMGAKTPRDYAELVQPPVFYYGFYLPQVMLIFVICIVYSVLRESWKILLAGLVYFLLGGFVYKYQLLYAMDHRHNSTGRAWLLIVHRVIIGLVLFQLTTTGQLALKGAFTRAALVAPLIIGTVWFSYVFDRSYRPLMMFISLSTIERNIPEEPEMLDPDGWEEEARIRYRSETRPGHTVDTSRTTGVRYVNPNLISPLEPVWIADQDMKGHEHDHDSEEGVISSNRKRFAAAVNAGL